ncbi:MAG TPA: glycosyltransferase [Acidimicrobiales bacterium]|nr:glycosyltransferase [Acidimicrobiales bacterium]
MHRLAVLSFHTSPLAQPGVGDSGGMNVYVRELVSALAQAGVVCDVFTRAWSAELAPEVVVEPGFRVVHVEAGPASEVPKEDLPELVPAFTDGVVDHITRSGDVDAIHANYWLSGVAGHAAKHRLGLPLVSTFHTLARVKAEADGGEPAGRSRSQSEAQVIACSDAILANGAEEAEQLRRHYDAQADRIEIVPPGVDHAFFAPGHRDGARAALGWGRPGRISAIGGRSADQHPVLLFVGRIQPLKGLDVAVATLARLKYPDAELVVVGGPSGADGPAELARVKDLIATLGLTDRVRFVDPQPHHVLPTWYRAADVVLVPSRSESFGLVALEAAACGRPVVAADVGGLRTVVDHGRTGYLVDDRRPEAYAARVAEILRDPALAERLGRGAAARAAGYTWSTAAARLRRLYTDLSARHLVRC